MKENEQNGKRNNQHILKNERQQRYDSMERIKQDVNARKWFEAEPYALTYQKELEKVQGVSGRDHDSGGSSGSE